jgi:hypothetical protein
VKFQPGALHQQMVFLFSSMFDRLRHTLRPALRNRPDTEKPLCSFSKAFDIPNDDAQRTWEMDFTAKIGNTAIFVMEVAVSQTVKEVEDVLEGIVMRHPSCQFCGFLAIVENPDPTKEHNHHQTAASIPDQPLPISSGHSQVTSKDHNMPHFENRICLWNGTRRVIGMLYRQHEKGWVSKIHSFFILLDDHNTI